MFKGKGLRKGVVNTGFYGCFRPGSSGGSFRNNERESIVVPEGIVQGPLFATEMMLL